MRHELCLGDCTEWLHQLQNSRKIDMIFADPPDGIGLNYNQYDDKITPEEYLKLLQTWVPLFCSKADTVWISFNSRWTLEMAMIAKSIKESGWEFKPCVQTFSFYQHNKHDLGNAHRPLWRFRKKSASLYPEQTKIPSWRQLNGDKRAAKGGKVPGDVAEFEIFSHKTSPLPNLNIQQIDRLLSKIDIKGQDDCWEWAGGKREGYGRVKIQNKLFAVTRLVWRLVHGSDPVGQCICHTCDNPGCCNPNHLFLGTQADNNRDKENKQRGNHPRGSNAGSSKLTEEDVINIFNSPESNVSLGKRYGVTDATIGYIKRGESWQHVTQDPMSDVFKFTRVTGNSKQRRKWHPTQLHEGLVERCVLLSTKPGDFVVDPFGGTGTTLRVCKRINRDCTLIELDETYCKEIVNEHSMVRRELRRWELECV